MNTRLPDADGTHRLGQPRPEPLLDALTRPTERRTVAAGAILPRPSAQAVYEARRFMRDRLVEIDAAVQAMLGHWIEGDYAPDLLAPPEYPFPSSLDDWQALVSGCHEYLTRALDAEADTAARIAATAGVVSHPDPDIVDAAGCTGMARGSDHVTWEDVARSLLARHSELEEREARHRAASQQDTDTEGLPVGWCYRDGEPFESTTEPAYDAVGGVKPTCEHAGDPPVDKSGQDWRDYLESVRRIRHIPGIGNAAESPTSGLTPGGSCRG